MGTRLLVGAILIGGATLASGGCQRSAPDGPIADAAAVKKVRLALVSATGKEPAGPAEQQKASGSGWSTLRGKFLFDGTPPERKPLLVNKDTEVCSPGGKKAFSQALLVDPSTRGIANVVIFVRNASRVHPSMKSGAKPRVFDQKTCRFVSHVFPVRVGQTFEIKNSDPVGHNTNIQAKKGTSFNQLVPAGESLSYTPTKEEALPVSVTCNIHPWMQSYILPRENGYVAVTSVDGSFELAHLPAGEPLEFQVWHESAKGAGGSLVVTTNATKEFGWSKRGRFTLTLEVDTPRDIEVEVPADAFSY